MHLTQNRRSSRQAQSGLLSNDEFGLELGEEYVRSVTSGDHAATDMRDEEVTEEHGGPFVFSTAGQEFAEGTDESNPIDAEVAALPEVSPTPEVVPSCLRTQPEPAHHVLKLHTEVGEVLRGAGHLGDGAGLIFHRLLHRLGRARVLAGEP